MQPMILTAALALLAIVCLGAAAHAAWRLTNLINHARKEKHE